MHGSLPTTSSPDDVRGVASCFVGRAGQKVQLYLKRSPTIGAFFMSAISVAGAVCVWFRLHARSASGFGCRRGLRLASVAGVVGAVVSAVWWGCSWLIRWGL